MCCRLFPLWSKIDAVVRGPAKVNTNEKDEETKRTELKQRVKETERERGKETERSRRIEKAKKKRFDEWNLCII